MSAGGVGSIPAAVELLSPRVCGDCRHRPSFDFFESNGGWELKLSASRPRPLDPARRRSDRPRRRLAERDELAVAALLHDVGRLVISRLHPGYRSTSTPLTQPRAAPARRREQLGIDHALVGGVLARAGTCGADRRRDRAPYTPTTRARRPGRDGRHGRPLLAGRGGLPGAVGGQRRALRTSSRPCATPLRAADGASGIVPDHRALPLSARGRRSPPPLRGHGLQADRREMHLSVSTIRTICTTSYGKIGAVDAPAVLTPATGAV